MIFDVESLTERKYETAIADFIGTHENTTGSYGAHHDGGDSIALGYGLDLLVNDNASINHYLRDSGIAELTNQQETRLTEARTGRRLRARMSRGQRSATLETITESLNLSLTQSQASDLLQTVLGPCIPRRSLG